MKKTLLVLLASSLVLAQCKSKKKTPAKAATPPPATASKTATIKDKTKNCRKVEGLFTFYQDTITGDAYMVVRKEQVGREFIYFSYSENGVVYTGHFRGAFRDNKVFSIQKNYERVEFVEQNTAFYFDPNNALSKAADANISNSIMASEKIIAEDTAKKEYLVDANALFLSEKLHQVKPSPSMGPLASLSFALGGLSKDKTKYASIRSYPANSDIVVEYVYDNPMPTAGAGPDVTDVRSVSVKIQHSLIEVPKNDYKPRWDDPRVGYFMTQVNDMTSPEATNFRDMIHRWNLVKKDPTAAMSEPVEPITWWIENTTPVEYRDIIKQAGLQWNLAFEKAGFKNAVRVEVQPDTATWDAGDIRYNVLRWTSSPNPPFGGYGPSFVNPRTGQILGADIMLEYVYLANRMRQEQLFDVAGIEQLFEERHAEGQNHAQYCEAGRYLQQTFMFGFNALMLNGASAAEKEEYIKQSIYYLVLHEMGHTMGLNHNMKASQLYSPDELADMSKTTATGIIGSVMDYPASNIRLDKSKQTFYFTTRPGPYDMWAIEFGYSTAVSDPAAEKARLETILSRSTEPALIFGNDADDMRSPGGGIDPRVNVNDLSSDAIGYSIERMQMSSKLMQTVKDKFAKPGKSYNDVRIGYLMLTSEYATSAATISRYVGGVYVDRGFAGQQGATQPFTPVKYDDQKRAMKALAQYVFAPNAMEAPKQLYNYLQMQRRGYNFFGNNEDPKLHDRILAIQTTALAQLLHYNTLRRMTDSRMYGNTYTVNEMLNDLTDAIFKDDMNGSVNTFRQNLQVQYVKGLIATAGLSPGMPRDFIAQSAALSCIKKLQGQLKLAVAKGDAETKAHRERMLFDIEKALETK